MYVFGCVSNNCVFPQNKLRFGINNVPCVSFYVMCLSTQTMVWSLLTHALFFHVSETKEQPSIPLSIGLPMLIISSLLLLIFAVVIVILAVYIVKQRKKRKQDLTAIPKILEHRANCDAVKKRPKSTNLEFLHATNDNRYNTAISRGDTDCFRPLVDENNHANEYVHC